jgi:hypothetical protein
MRNALLRGVDQEYTIEKCPWVKEVCQPRPRTPKSSRPSTCISSTRSRKGKNLVHLDTKDSTDGKISPKENHSRPQSQGMMTINGFTQRHNDIGDTPKYDLIKDFQL